MRVDRPRFAIRKEGLRYFIAICAGTASLASGSAHVSAQEIEEVMVTGSRITRATNASATQPLSTISSDALKNTSVTDIAEILNDNPSLLSSVSSANSVDDDAANVDNTDNVGGSTLDLRGMGFERTLTLVNGRRHVAGIEGTSAVDVSTIPAALIEQVEVLTGGASAVYGADAVTGVVNFVLKDDFEGAEIDFRTSMSSKGDAETNVLSGLFGKNFADGRGNVVLALQSSSTAGLRAGDRKHTANDGLYSSDVNPALRFQTGDIDAGATPNFSEYYNYANTGLFPVGLRIPSVDSFVSSYTSAFGAAPTLTSAELALIERAASAPGRVLMPGRGFNITSPYGIVAIGDFGTGEYPLGSEPDLDGNGVPDCLDSFTGYNSNGEVGFGYAGGCWRIDESGVVRPAVDGLVAGNFNHFGNETVYIAPNSPFVIPKEQQHSINLNGTFHLGDNHTAFIESKYVTHKVDFGGNSHNFTDMLYGAPDNPYLPAELAAYANNTPPGWFGPGGLRISRDSDDWGPNIDTNKRETVRFVTGLKGTMELLDLDYEVSANYGRFKRKLLDRETMIVDRFFAAIDAVTDPETGQPVCRSDLDPTAYPETTPFNIPAYVGGGVKSSFFTFTPGDGQCKPANIWGGRGAISQEAVDFMTYTRTVEEEIEQKVVTAFVSGDTSSFFELPAGPISFVFGGEWRDEGTSQKFDRYDQGILPVSGVTSDGIAFTAGQLVGEVSEANSLGVRPATRLISGASGYDVLDLFAEIEVPILVDRFLAEDLTLSTAVRSADYSTFGENTTYKVGITWSPIYDLMLRTNYSEAVRVPNLYELYSPEQGQFFRPQDPCDVAQLMGSANPSNRQANCVAGLQAAGVPNNKIFDAQGNYIFVDPLSAGFPGVVGGNPDLEPEKATTQTLGFVYQPSFLDGLIISVDFWDIEINGAISDISAQNIVDSCYDAASINNPFCELTARNPDPTSAQSGGFVFLRQAKLNFGSAEAQGFDTTVAYSFGISDYLFDLSLGVTKQNKLNFIEPSNAGEAAKVDVELGEMRRPEWAAQFNAGVSWGDFSLMLNSSFLSKQTLSYEDGVEIETVDQNYGPAGYTDAFWTHNLSGRYDYNQQLRIYGGINNLTDEDPFATERGYPVSVVGRAFFLGLNYAF